MVYVPTEKRYEKHIETELNNLIDDGLQFHSKIHKKGDGWYDKNLCVVGSEFMTFLKESQTKTYEKLSKKYGDSIHQKVLSRLNKEIENKGLIHVLRKGFNDIYVGNIKTVFFQPNSSLNEKYRDEKYLKNKFLLVRQLAYSTNNNNSIDIGIFINGIPILTIELKNQFTGQNYKDSENQYKNRDPKEPIFQFKRCIVHFCADNNNVSMTTRISGKKTFFFPYNRDLINPPVKKGYRTKYLWEKVLTPDSLLDIIENFVHLAKPKDYFFNEKTNKIDFKRNI